MYPFPVSLRARWGKRLAATVAGLGLLMATAAPRGAAAQNVTCFLGGPPNRPVPVCYPDPRDPDRSEVRPDRAALYCDFWVASGTILPCPYTRSAVEFRRPTAEPTTSDDPVEAEQERGNRWRQRRD